MTKRKDPSPQEAERLFDDAIAQWDAKFHADCKTGWTQEVCRAESERRNEANARYWRERSGFLTDEEISGALTKASSMDEAADIIAAIYMRQVTYVSRARRQSTPNFKRTIRRFANDLSKERSALFRMVAARLVEIADNIPNGEGGRPPGYETTIVQVHAPIIAAVLQEPDYQTELRRQSKLALSKLDAGQGAHSSFRGASSPKRSCPDEWCTSARAS